jgi:archaellum component FlaC
VESLVQLENNLQQLLEQHNQLKQQLLDLQRENERQHEEIRQSYAELVALKNDYKHLETAYALLAENTDEAQRERVKQRLSNLIAQVDRAIEALKN